MNICLECKTEMRCVKTGMVAVYAGDHCYSGDAFECPECAAQILVTTENAYYDPRAVDAGGINMDDWPSKKCPPTQTR